ncbi:MAG: NADPH-dependent FMN reductase [Polyangiales bacterium]|nr:NAD(P)H-dependent oxidoreductase [Myxococcales bacterium]MCB9662214.1 NAD(P)H-dependent oxidoreductase [Sandaracinaceae bacterium]
MSTDPRTIAVFTGSLRPDGVSAATAHSAKAALPAHLRAVDVDFSGFPLYDPRLHLMAPGDPEGADLPEPVRAAFRLVRDSAGVLVVTPEYNYGVPGPLKNALDWLSRPAYKSVFAGRPVAVMSASPSPAGAVRAQGALKTVLGGMMAQVFVYPEVALAGPFSKRGEDGGLADPAARERVTALVQAFAASL